MDLVNQNKFKNFLIIVLLVVNLLTVSIIWMQTSRRDEVPSVTEIKRPSESVNLMQQALNLDEGQTKQFEKIRNDKLGQAKKYNDRLDDLKKQLADELLNSNPDTSVAKVKAKEIGEMQSKVELIRFEHFKELIKICTPEQKEKLKPIMKELFGKKPPRDESIVRKQINNKREEKELRDSNAEGIEKDKTPRAHNERPAPPSIDEKISKLTERLNLSENQVGKVKSIFASTRNRDEKLRRKMNPDPAEIENEKESNRKLEDESIMKILNEDQQKEYSKMMLKRRR